MDGERGQGEGHEHLEGAALERPFLDPVDLEDRQEQCQVDEIAQEQPQAAPARFGLTGIEARCLARARAPGCFRSTEDTAGAAAAWASMRPSFAFPPPWVRPLSRLIRSTGVARDCRDSAG